MAWNDLLQGTYNGEQTYFPMFKSIGDGLARYGNKVQNAFLKSGINNNTGNRKSGRVSYTAGTPPVTDINPPAPRISTVPASTLKPTKTTPTRDTRKGLSKESGGMKAQPPLVANTTVPTTTVPTLAGNLDGWGDGMSNAVPTQAIEFDTTGLARLNVPSGGYTNAYGNTVDAVGGNGSFFNSDNMKTGAQALQALGGLANAYTGYKAYGLAKDQFDFEKALANANYVNAARAYNTDLTNASNVGLALGGGAMTPEQIAAARAYTQSRTVSERPIG